MKIKKLLVLGALAVFALNANAAIIDSAVATVNSKPILQSDYEKLVDSFMKQYQEQAPQVAAQPAFKLQLERDILNQMIADEVLYQAAVAADTKVREDEVNQMVEKAKESLVPETDPETGKKRSEKERKKLFTTSLKKEGLSEAQFKDMLKKQLISKKFFETGILSKTEPVTDEETKKLYDDVNAFLKNDKKKMDKVEPALRKAEVQAIAARLKQLSAPMVKVGQIFIATPSDLTAAQVKEKEKLAKEIKAKIDGGMDFSVAVRELSEDKDKLMTGGDMIIVKGMEGTPENFEKRAFSLDVGKISEPVKTPFGYHIIKVKEKKAAEEITYEKVAPDFMRYLAEIHKQDYLKKQYEAADIKINKDFSELEALIAKAQEEAAAKEAAAKK